MHFDYHLPEHLIAQHPAARRDESRLLVVRRGSGAIEHRTFRDLPELLALGDLLVLNDTRVLPARLLGRRERTGGKWEGLFLGSAPDGSWERLCHTRGRPRRRLGEARPGAGRAPRGRDGPRRAGAAALDPDRPARGPLVRPAGG